MTLWLGAAVLCLLTVLVALAPRRRTNTPASVRGLYQNRLAELEAEHANGRLSSEELAALRDELGASVLTDLEREAGEVEASPTVAAAAHSSTRWALSVALALPLVAAATYFAVGEPDAPWLANSADVLNLDPNTERSQIREIADALTERTSRHSEDHQSWYLLGHAHLKLERFAAAADAFEAVFAVTGPDRRLDAYWLQARFLAADGQLDAGSMAIAERLLAGNPNDALTLEILALSAYREGRYADSAAYLQRALSGPAGEMPPTQRASLERGLAQARSELGDLTPSIDVTVTLAEAPPPGSALFVLARPLGQRMPLAVVRQPATAGTVSVRLDDTTAMNPALTLSSVSQVEVIARVSRSGTAAADPADWRWQSDPIQLAPDARHRLDVTLAPPSLPPAGV